MRYPVAALVTFALLGCATGESLGTDDRMSTVTITTGDGQTIQTGVSGANDLRRYGMEGTVDEVWSRLPGAFAALGFEVNSGSPRAHILGVENIRLRRINRQRPSEYVDCGQGPTGATADSYDVYLSLLAQVLPDPEGAAVTVRLTARATNPAHGGSGVGCMTKGRLEDELVAALRD